MRLVETHFKVETWTKGLSCRVSKYWPRILIQRRRRKVDFKDKKSPPRPDAEGSQGRTRAEQQKNRLRRQLFPVLIVVGFFCWIWFFSLPPYVRFSCVLWAAHMTGNYLSSCQLCTVALCQDQNEESEDIPCSIHIYLYICKYVAEGMWHGVRKRQSQIGRLPSQFAPLTF